MSKARFQYSPAKVNQALNAISEGMPVAKASRTFAIPRTTLRNKISGKSLRESKHCGFEIHFCKKVEEQLLEWILTCAKMGFPIDKRGLLTSVQKLVRGAMLKLVLLIIALGRNGTTVFLIVTNSFLRKKLNTFTVEEVQLLKRNP